MKEVTIVYGIHAIESVLKTSPDNIQSIFIDNRKKNKRIEQLQQAAKAQGCQSHLLDKKSFDKKVAGVGNHQGVIAELKAPPSFSEYDIFTLLDQNSAPALILILDGITDPHNLGACLRSADAFGVDMVIAPKDKSAGITSAVRKVACGGAETVPFIQVTNLVRVIKQLQEKGVWVYGAAGETDRSLYQQKFDGPTAIILGAEGQGMRRLTRENCDVTFAIPMVGTVESLNVSVACGVVLAEVQRQKNS